MKDHDTSQEYISAFIHKNFYHNESFDTPTVIKEYGRIEQILDKSRYLACITIHVDQLKRIEYLYGGATYNDLLNQVTTLLKALKETEFRTSDILLVDLFDHDTFIIFLTEPRNQDTQLLNHLEKIVDRTRNSLQQRLFQIFYPYTKSIDKPSVGYAMVIVNSMVSRTRQVMQLVESSKKMGEFMAQKFTFQSKFQLQKIIIEGEINTVYQPIVCMRSMEILGYEALSRGPEDSEFANPLMMFMLAAEHGLSFELDTLCRRRAFENILHLGTDKKIFVNTLAITLHDPEFRGKYLEQLLEDLRVKPENVIFEINEKMAIENYDVFRRAIKDYADIGIVHASDDVGTGYCDLERIMELNPGYMKIDISLVCDIDKSYIKQQIVRAMVSLAKGLGSEIIAEGIETREEFETLKGLQVSYGQGYLFGRPSEALQGVNQENFRAG